VVNSLPKINNLSIKVQILIRLDIGSGHKGVPFSYFINEIEFVPSLYIEDQKYPVLKDLSEGLVKVAKEYSQKN
jgi:hypothetical protein